MNNRLVKIIALITAVAFLYQNIGLADAYGLNRHIAPESVFENFDKYFGAKKIGLPLDARMKIFGGFKKISEEFFPLSPKEEDGLDKTKILAKAGGIIDEYCPGYVKPKDSRVLAENGNKFFTIDIDFITQRGIISKTVVFYDQYRIPYKYLKSVTGTWEEEDEIYASERGFWIISKGMEKTHVFNPWEVDDYDDDRKRYMEEAVGNIVALLQRLGVETDTEGLVLNLGSGEHPVRSTGYQIVNVDRKYVPYDLKQSPDYRFFDGDFSDRDFKTALSAQEGKDIKVKAAILYNMWTYLKLYSESGVIDPQVWKRYIESCFSNIFNNILDEGGYFMFYQHNPPESSSGAVTAFNEVREIMLRCFSAQISEVHTFKTKNGEPVALAFRKKAKIAESPAPTNDNELTQPKVPCPVSGGEKQIAEALMNGDKDFVLRLMQDEVSRLWLAYVLKKIFVLEPSSKVEKTFSVILTLGQEHSFTKIFFSSLMQIDPAKAGLVLVYLSKLCTDPEMKKEFKDALESSAVYIKGLLADIASRWQLDADNLHFLRVFFMSKVKNRKFMMQLNFHPGKDENKCYITNAEMGTVIEIIGDAIQNVFEIAFQNLPDSHLTFYFPDDLIPYIEYLLGLEHFYFPFRERIKREIQIRKNAQKIRPEMYYTSFVSLYRLTISREDKKCPVMDYLSKLVEEYGSMKEDKNIALESIIVEHRGIKLLLVYNLKNIGGWIGRRCPYKIAGFISDNMLFPIDDQHITQVEEYLSSLDPAELRHEMYCKGIEGEYPEDEFLELAASGREQVYAGHDLALGDEIEQAIKNIKGPVSIVDIGMGGGELLLKLTRRFAGDKRISYFGNELDSKALKLAEMRLPDYVEKSDVPGENLLKAGFAEKIKGTYSIAVLEGVAAFGVTDTHKAYEILQGLIDLRFDKILITGNTQTNLAYSDIEPLLPAHGYKLERTLCPKNLFNHNLPKYMLVLSRVDVQSIAGDGFIQSKKGRAPAELGRIRAEQREKLRKTKTKDFERIKAYIQNKIELLEVKNKSRRIKETVRIAKEGLDLLKRLYDEGKIFAFDAIVYGREDYALGFGSSEEMGIAQELIDMNLSIALMSELLFHEAVCFRYGHKKARKIQEILFTENYTRRERKAHYLKRILRSLINEMAVIERAKRITRTESDWEQVERVVGVKGIQMLKDPYRQLNRGLTRDEEKKLVHLYRDKNNGAALDVLLNFNIRFIYTVARGFVRRNRNLSPELDDLVQEGRIGFTRAVDNFDTEKGVKVNTYAEWWIKQHIGRYIANHSRTVRIPVHTREKLNKLYKAEEMYFRLFNKEPKTYEDIIGVYPEFELTKEEYEKLTGLYFDFSIDEAASETDERTGHDLISGDGEERLVRTVRTAEFYAKLKEAFELMEKDEKFKNVKALKRAVKILGLFIGYDVENGRIIDRLSAKKIANLFDISPQRVRMIIEKYMPFLKKILKKLGISEDFFDDLSGAMKNVGPPLDEAVIKEAEEKEPEWRRLAKSIKPKQYTKFKIRAKVLKVSDLPFGMNAWHFREEEDKPESALVIVTRDAPEKILHIDELIYHELREEHWLNEGLEYRDAHILASYEQVLAFGEEGRITAYHKSQIQNMEILQLQFLLNENKTRVRTRLHHIFIKSYKKVLEGRFGADALQRIVDYENILISEVKKIYERKTGKMGYVLSEETSRRIGVLERNILLLRDRFRPGQIILGIPSKKSDMPMMDVIIEGVPKLSLLMHYEMAGIFAYHGIKRIVVSGDCELSLFFVIANLGIFRNKRIKLKSNEGFVSKDNIVHIKRGEDLIIGREGITGQVKAYRKSGVDMIEADTFRRLKDKVEEVKKKYSDKILDRAIKELGFASLRVFIKIFGRSKEFDSLVKKLIEEAFAIKGKNIAFVLKYLGVGRTYLGKEIKRLKIDLKKIKHSEDKRLKEALEKQSADKTDPYNIEKAILAMGYPRIIDFRSAYRSDTKVKGVLKKYFIEIFQKFGRNIPYCAKVLGVKEDYFRTWLKELGIRLDELTSKEGKRLDDVLNSLRESEIREKGPLDKIKVNDIWCFNLPLVLKSMGWANFREFIAQHGNDPDVKRVLKKLFEDVLDLTYGNNTSASKLLGIKENTLVKWRKKLGVSLQLSVRRGNIAEHLKQVLQNLPKSKRERLDITAAILGFGSGNQKFSLVALMRKHGRDKKLRRFLKEIIIKALKGEHFSKEKAAKRLGISYAGLYKYMKMFKIDEVLLLRAELRRFKSVCEGYKGQIPNLNNVAKGMGYPNFRKFILYNKKIADEIRGYISTLSRKVLNGVDGSFSKAAKLLGISETFLRESVGSDRNAWSSSGALKEVGPPLDSAVIEEAKRKEPKWRRIAKDAEVKEYTRFKIKAKVIEVDDLTEGLVTWHFRDEEGGLIIVTRVPPIDEIIFHEYREDYWMGRGLSWRDAHILASYEQVIEFSEEGELTKYHESQIENVPIAEERSYHHELVKRYLGDDILLKIKIYENHYHVRACKELAGIGSRLGSSAQGVTNINRLQFAVPAEVLKGCTDFGPALRKMGMLNRRNAIFELIVYDLEDELEGERFRELINLPNNIRVYSLTKREAGAIDIRDIIKCKYPLREDDYLMVASKMMSEDEAEKLRDRLSSDKYQNVSFGIVVEPDETSVISLSNILLQLMGDMGRDNLKIILPVPVFPQEIKRHFEEDVRTIWELLEAA